MTGIFCLNKDDAYRQMCEEQDILLLVDLLNEGRNVVFEDVKKCIESRFAEVPKIIKEKYEELCTKRKRGRATSLKSESFKRAFPDDFLPVPMYIKLVHVLESHGFCDSDIHASLARYYDEKTVFKSLRSLGFGRERALDVMVEIISAMKGKEVGVEAVWDRIYKRKKNDRDRRSSFGRMRTRLPGDDF